MPLPTPKAAVIGWPIAHSLSPRLHQFWLRSCGIAGSYEALAVRPEQLEQTLRALHDRGYRGVNLTVPHKETACALVDIRDEAAQRIGAVNLITVGEDGKLYGRNTDAYGFRENLAAAGFKPTTGAAFVLGAGGAARAVIFALAQMGFADIRIANRSIERAQRLAQEFSTASCSVTAVAWEGAPRHLSDIELLVNATSLGMAGQPDLQLALDALPVSATVTDIVYTPLRTSLLQRAARRGNATIDGLGMLLHQARPSFAAFFGRDPQVTPELRDYVVGGQT